jgi:hypothetical protein
MAKAGFDKPVGFRAAWLVGAQWHVKPTSATRRRGAVGCHPRSCFPKAARDPATTFDVRVCHGTPIRENEPKIYVDADRAFELIKKGNALKLAALLSNYSTPSTTKRFEENYAHRRNQSLNPHQLRDDIEANWTSPFLKQNAKQILNSLELRNPLPPKVSHEQVTDSAIEAKWPAAARAATRERLKQSSTWPAKYQHATLIAPIRDWGNWILDNTST